MVASSETPGNHIVPYRLAIAASPKIKPEQVLWYEDMAQIFAREDQIGERCFFNAIEMRLTLTSKKKKAHVIKDFCMGCGSCIVGYEHKAINRKS